MSLTKYDIFHRWNRHWRRPANKWIGRNHDKTPECHYKVTETHPEGSKIWCWKAFDKHHKHHTFGFWQNWQLAKSPGFCSHSFRTSKSWWKRHNLTSNNERLLTDFHLSLPSKLRDHFNQDRSLVYPQRRRPISIEHTMAGAVSAKIEEGNIRAATRILCSGMPQHRLTT